MFSLKDIKEKLSKEKAVETTIDSTSEKPSIYADKPSKFKVKIVESDILSFLDYKVTEHNEKAKPDKKIEASDVVNVIVEKALLENTLLYQFTKTYEDLKKESLDIRTAVYQLHYYNYNTVPLAKENKKLKAELKTVKEKNTVLSEAIEEYNTEIDSIKSIVEKWK